MNLRMPPAIWFWIVAVLLFFWSLADLTAFLTEALSPDTIIASLNDAQRQVFKNRPLWYVYVTGFAAITGALAATLLLMRNKVAVILAILSFIAVLVGGSYKLFTGNLGADGLTSQNLLLYILFYDIVMIVFAIYASKRRWIV